MSGMEIAEGTLVLGIGNLLWADEGFGVRAVEALNEGYRFAPHVTVMDGGTQGMFLLPHVTAACNLLILDAIDFGLKPGELRLILDRDVPQYLGAKKISMHQTGFQEVLASADLLGRLPRRLALVGVQPCRLDDYGGSLRPDVKRRIPEAVAMAIRVLETWGVSVTPRGESPERSEPTGPRALSIERYEERTE
ncbi:MAG: HyaD/HybD family hydrogenase maturation endopeptidase [Gammaproteobacteria bacterium]|nr:HyaD/HybD family hydrogenase maturation endopeptidase [Gammaproteobacteria bacterium]